MGVVGVVGAVRVMRGLTVVTTGRGQVRLRLTYAIGSALLLLSLVSPRTFAAQTPATDLPDGPGKAVLLSACTTCHELTEVTKFKGFYTKDEWRDIVVTMVKYGAVVKNDDVPVLVDYLFKNFGKKE